MENYAFDVRWIVRLSEIHRVLKTETDSLHEQFERLSFFGALHTNILPKVAIVSFLRSLSIIYAVLEKSLSLVSDHQISELYKSTLPKVPLLVADLEVLNATSLASVVPAIRGALDYADEILTSAENPLNLIGPLYVLEGSQNGVMALKPEYARCLNIPNEQLSYFGCYGSDTAMRWKAFLGRLNSLPLEGDQSALVAASAVRCFERVGRICAALYAYSCKDLKHHISAINFEAGDHAMPQNPLEIDLALRAAKVAWEKYPYLKHRYGERGRRFTCSDSCWLVTLTRAPGQAAVTKALEWLRTVLASRGIPTVILEFHLQAILQAIGTEFPDQPDMQIQFNPFLSDRKVERRRLFGAESRLHLIDVFDKRFRACTGFRVESTAELVTSAWVDEHSGLSGSLSVLCDWFTDAERFSTDWVANVQELLVELDRTQGQLS
jgi:heme oxygenase